MRTKSSNNWASKSGTWDSYHVEYIKDIISGGEYPIIGTTQCDFENVISCNEYKKIDKNTLISMFVDDYILERFWNNPKNYIEKYKNAACVMSPDYSLLIGMPAPMQRWVVYKNRLVGKLWQNAGLNVVPTITWSDKNSFEYCFEGVEHGSVVAISNLGCNNEFKKEYFDAGLSELKLRIDPCKIIFQCNEKYKNDYSDENTIFIKSFFNRKNI